MTLATALDELQAWLDDGRVYDSRFHAAPWKSMTADVTGVLEGRGPSVTSQTASLSELIKELQAPDLGDDKGRRGRCAGLVKASWIELAQLPAGVAAFDDLVEVAERTQSPFSRLGECLEVLQVCIRAAGRTAAPLLESLGGILGDNLLHVKAARRELGEAATFKPVDLGLQAGLTVKQRVDLCRRLLQQQDPNHSHVVWFCFDNAKVRPAAVDFGPITFYDGKRLIEAISDGTEVAHTVSRGNNAWGHDLRPVPPELPGSDEPWRWGDWPPSLNEWVVARVELKSGTVIHPIREAAEQVDTAVRLAAFHQGGTTWRRLKGCRYLRDGRLQDTLQSWDNYKSHVGDETFHVLQVLGLELGPHLPVRDPRMHDLLDAAAILDSRYDDIDTTSIVHSVRVIERVASLCGSKTWEDHLEHCRATAWARAAVSQLIENAIRGADHVPGLQSLPNEAKLYTYRNGRKQMNLDIAIQQMSSLAAEMPWYHPSARLIRTVAKKTATPGKLNVWVKEHISHYRVLTSRLARCRNSMAHGGPLNENTAATVKMLAWTEAKATTHTALWALVAGNDLEQEHQRQQQTQDQWRTSLAGLPTVADAFR